MTSFRFSEDLSECAHVQNHLERIGGVQRGLVIGLPNLERLIDHRRRNPLGCSRWHLGEWSNHILVGSVLVHAQS